MTAYASPAMCTRPQGGRAPLFGTSGLDVPLRRKPARERRTRTPRICVFRFILFGR